MTRTEIIRAMQAAGYFYDSIESEDGDLRFFSLYGTVSFSCWHEVADWLNGVVFDDPDVSDAVEEIMKEVSDYE